MSEKRQIQFERYTNLPLGSNWAGEWPAYVLVHHEGAVDDVRYVPERTCRRVEYRPTGNLICSECGYGIPRALDRHAFVIYCPHCGARIVKEGD